MNQSDKQATGAVKPNVPVQEAPSRRSGAVSSPPLGVDVVDVQGLRAHLDDWDGLQELPAVIAIYDD